MKDMRDVQRREIQAFSDYEVMQTLAAVDVERLVWFARGIALQPKRTNML